MTYQEALQARARIAYSKNALTKIALKIDKKDGGAQAAPAAPAADAQPEGMPPAVYEQWLAHTQGANENLVNENQALKQQVQDDLKLKHGLGASGVGLAGGAGIGAATYGLTGLFPSLKKRRLLRALIALGAGGAGGAGLGYLTYGGLQSGKVQNWANKAMGAASDAANWAGQKAQDAKAKIGGGGNDSGKESKTEDKSGDGK